MNKKIFNCICLTTFILLVVQVWMSSWRATDGDKLAETQERISNLEIENSRLREKVYELTSLENISLFAKNTGMKPALITNLSSITVAMTR